jgi:hypothetical protein
VGIAAEGERQALGTHLALGAVRLRRRCGLTALGEEELCRGVFARGSVLPALLPDEALEVGERVLILVSDQPEDYGARHVHRCGRVRREARELGEPFVGDGPSWEVVWARSRSYERSPETRGDLRTSLTVVLDRMNVRSFWIRRLEVRALPRQRVKVRVSAFAAFGSKA